MGRKRIFRRAGLLFMVVAMAGAGGPGTPLADSTQSESSKRPFTKDFPLDDCTWVTGDDPVVSPGNPLFPLIPGSWRLYEGEEKDAEIRLQITTCLDDGSNCTTHDGTHVPGVYTTAYGVAARVVEEREWEDGELVEVSHNYFARCEENNAIFYWGEAVEIVEDGVVVAHSGAWEAGIDDAVPGVVMPGLFLLGARYHQEVAPGVAQDRGENVAMNLELEIELLGGGALPLEGCVQVFETSALASKDRSTKIYCPGVGLTIDDVAVLVDMNP